MRIVVITDVHANLPALKATLREITELGYDAIYHTGDCIGIGPHPAECLELLINTPYVYFTMGNHDSLLVNGIPKPQPKWLSDGEVQHQLWTHSQISPELKGRVCTWPYFFEREFEGVKVAFAHYGLTESRHDFAPFVSSRTATPPASDLKRIFSFADCSLVFYGHDHSASDVQDNERRYFNPGSLGCSITAEARYCIAEFNKGHYTVEHCSVPYDDTELFKAFEQREVPDRQFLYKLGFGGRFPK